MLTSEINLIIVTTMSAASIDISNIQTIQSESSMQPRQSVSLKSGGDRSDVPIVRTESAQAASTTALWSRLFLFL